MSKHIKILTFIRTIRESHPDIEYIYMNGSCLNFHFILKSVYPESIPYFNINHIVTRIDDKYYDITGVVDITKASIPYIEYYKVYPKRGLIKSHKRMYNIQYKKSLVKINKNT